MSNRFDIQDTPISNLKIIQRKLLGDQRGYLERLFCIEELKALIQKKNILQINHTVTKTQGTIRGMHFQILPFPEVKLVSCLKGEVYDIAVDLRLNSPTYLSYHAEVLSADNHKTFFIPEGFAHGFQTLTPDCEMLYFHTNYFYAEAERGLNALDPLLNIKWPLPIAFRSERDMSHQLLDKNFMGISI